MKPTMQDYGIDKLSIEDRIDLAHQLWDSAMADLEQQPLTDAQKAELDRRGAEFDADPSIGVPWEVVLAEARARWKK